VSTQGLNSKRDSGVLLSRKPDRCGEDVVREIEVAFWQDVKMPAKRDGESCVNFAVPATVENPRVARFSPKEETRKMTKPKEIPELKGAERDSKQQQ
jgi:hypothetical protein